MLPNSGETSTVSAVRSHVHHAPMFNNHIYFAAGMVNNVDQVTTYVGTFH